LQLSRVSGAWDKKETILMKLTCCLCTALSLVVLPLAADPIDFVVLNGNTPGALLRYSQNGVTTITTLASGGDGLTKDLNGNYIVVNGSALFRVTPTGTLSTLVNAPAGTPNPQWIAVAADSAGNLIAADNSQHAIWKITPGSPLSVVTKVANYPVSAAAELEDVQILVDGSGNYVVLEDNDFHPQMFSITPAGTVTLIPLSGASVKSIWGFVSDGAENYLFGDSGGALYRVTPAGVVTKVANISAISSVAVNPDTGDMLASTWDGHILQVSSDGSLSWRSR
jgi:hypothetical protein